MPPLESQGGARFAPSWPWKLGKNMYIFIENCSFSPPWIPNLPPLEKILATCLGMPKGRRGGTSQKYQNIPLSFHYFIDFRPHWNYFLDFSHICFWLQLNVMKLSMYVVATSLGSGGKIQNVIWPKVWMLVFILGQNKLKKNRPNPTAMIFAA